MLARLTSSALALGLLFGSADAAADDVIAAKPPAPSAQEGPPHDDPWQIFAPVGINVGASFNPKRLDNGFILGGEASVAVTNRELLWFGGYVDALHDFGADATRISIGPELGLFIVGLDGGLVLSTLDGLHAGIVGRVLLTLPIVSGYARIGTVFDSPQEGVYGEIGALIKIPIPVATGGSPPLQRKVGPPPDPSPEPPPPDLPLAK